MESPLYFASTRLAHTNRCINQGVGGHMPRDINRRTMVTEGMESSHRHTKGSAFSHSSEDTSPDGQENIFDLPGKNGGTHNKDLLGLSKQIWDYLQLKKITVTAVYLPGHVNVTADWESRNFQGKSNWKLFPKVFAKICPKLGTPSIDLFSSRMSHKLPVYMAWKPDPECQANNAMYQSWAKIFPYAFAP